MIDETKYSVTVLVISHWLFEREVEAEESEDVTKQLMLCEDDYITEIADKLQQLYNKDENDPLFRAILGEYNRQHPFYDGKWWLEGRPWNMTKKEFERLKKEKESLEETKKVQKYPEYIIKMLRQNHGYEEDDNRFDEELQAMSPDIAFARVCEWEGLINYSSIIKEWIEAIYGINLDEIDEDKKKSEETHFF